MLKRTAVSAYASPEGEITLNEDLALERAESANAAVARLLSRGPRLKWKRVFTATTPRVKTGKASSL